MAKYFERYLNGEREQVWLELIALGSEIRQEPLYQDTLAVARETMRRAKDNIETLSLRLLELNYSFLDTSNFFRISDQKDLTYLARIEEIIEGTLPVSLLAWYELVGEVAFLANKSEFFNFDKILKIHHNSNLSLSVTDMLNPIRPLSDPIEIFPPIATIQHLQYIREAYEEGQLVSLDYEFVISGDAASKAHQHNEEMIIIKIPNAAADAQIEGVWDWGNLTFVEYLRENFRWGGFPGLVNSSNPPKEILEFLTKDLLPI
jgi:hypothetical protein